MIKTVAYLTACGLAALLAGGCSEEQAKVAATDTGSEPLVIYTWEDYLAPEICKLFTQRTGIPLEVRSFDNTDEMTDQVKSKPSTYDILIIDDSIVGRLRELKLIRPLESDGIIGLENIDPKFLGQEQDPQNKYSIPYFWGTTLIAYNKKILPNPTKSWGALWGREVKGKLMVYNEKNELFATTMLMLGHDANSEDPKHVKEASDALFKQATNLEAKYGSDADVREALISEDVWIAMMYSGDAAYIGEDNPDIDFFIPEEGAPMWLDSMVLTRDSIRGKQAHRFISFMLEAEIAAINANYYRFASPNSAAQPLLDHELRADERLTPPENILATFDYLREMSPEKEIAISKVMRKLLRFTEGEEGAAPIPLAAKEQSIVLKGAELNNPEF